jgi:protein-S-isoprenylcysteine O-methyltransferase Ste14
MSPKFLSVSGYLLMVGALIVLILTKSVFSPHPVVIALQVLAAVVMIWARVTFGRRSFHLAANPTEGKLVTTGPYRFVRHPIYAAILLFVWAGVGGNLSFLSVIRGLVLTGGVMLRIGTEERLLRAKYPEYLDYSHRTRRVIPWVL